MTIYQIAALLILGPIGFMGIVKVTRTVGTTFNILEALILFACIIGILVAFLGIK